MTNNTHKKVYVRISRDGSGGGGSIKRIQQTVSLKKIFTKKTINCTQFEGDERRIKTEFSATPSPIIIIIIIIIIIFLISSNFSHFSSKVLLNSNYIFFKFSPVVKTKEDYAAP